MLNKLCKLCDQGAKKSTDHENLTRFRGNKWDGTAAIVSPCVCPTMEVYLQMAISIGNLIEKSGNYLKMMIT